MAEAQDLLMAVQMQRDANSNAAAMLIAEKASLEREVAKRDETIAELMGQIAQRDNQIMAQSVRIGSLEAIIERAGAAPVEDEPVAEAAPGQE